MAYVLERHKIDDYDRWRAVFDADTDNRADSGSLGARIFRDADDPTEVVVLFEYDSFERARERIDSGALREKFDEAGVAGGVEGTKFYFLEEEGSMRA